MLDRAVALGGLPQLTLGEPRRLGPPGVPHPGRARDERREQLATAGGAAGLLTAGVMQLVHEGDVTRDVMISAASPTLGSIACVEVTSSRADTETGCAPGRRPTIFSPS